MSRHSLDTPPAVLDTSRTEQPRCFVGTRVVAPVAAVYRAQPS